jgi:UDP-galactopyranose mutase
MLRGMIERRTLMQAETMRKKGESKMIQPLLPDEIDLLCFSHLRWDFVYQRPQHIMTRFARSRRVFYFEEPQIHPGQSRMAVKQEPSGVWILTPYLKDGLSVEKTQEEHIRLINQALIDQEINRYIVWYYTPMAVAYARHLEPKLTVFDCMDELSAFNGAPQKMQAYESELFRMADVVFTGGVTLYEAKRKRHPNVHAFPSSIDLEHFRQARQILEETPDQQAIPHPRIGFFGVIDERMDLDLIAGIADARPDWHLVMIGPVTKLDPNRLPRRSNIHYLGKKSYESLPQYLAGWDVAILPFAQNEATRFISPTKTPEYLAGGKPVVSSPILDVVRPYGELGLVRIAEGIPEFVRAIEKAIQSNNNPSSWLAKVDKFLKKNSWDITCQQMELQMEKSLKNKGASMFSGNNLGAINPVTQSLPATVQGFDIKVKKENGKNGRHKTFDYLIVGAGFAGSILAERLARGSGNKVLIIDKRPHIAGNAYDHYDESGLLVHKYGPHIFHTNSREVFKYLSQFTPWRPYEHRVLASVDGQLLPIPINLDTVNRLYGLELNSFELEKFFESVAEPTPKVKTSEDVVVSKVGRELYEKFFRNYTRKQWDLDPSELDSSVTARVPIRMNRDDRYFSDQFQAMPLYGYTQMFGNILDHPNIRILLNTDYREIIDYVSYRHMIFTGPIDEYFDYSFGKLPYRSLQFKFETLDKPIHQPVAVINYPNEHVYTRSTEFKHLTGQEHHKTSLVYEYPCSEGDPYYPIPRLENADLYKKYKKLAESVSGVTFAGRLGTYKYYNMDQVTAQALMLYGRLSGSRSEQIQINEPESEFMIGIPCPLLYASNLE